MCQWHAGSTLAAALSGTIRTCLQGHVPQPACGHHCAGPDLPLEGAKCCWCPSGRHRTVILCTTVYIQEAKLKSLDHWSASFVRVHVHVHGLGSQLQCAVFCHCMVYKLACVVVRHVRSLQLTSSAPIVHDPLCCSAA